MPGEMRILILGGLANLAYGVLMGFFFAQARSTKEFAPRYLVLAHVGPFLQGTMLLALVVALPMIHLSDTFRTLGSALLVAASACFLVKDTINWRLGVTDEFRQKPPVPRLLAGVGAIADLVGLGILVVGVFL